MKTIVFLAAVFSAMASFAQEKAQKNETDQKQTYVQMHDHMAKAHQQAADCLKAGKSEEECQKAFHEMCKEAGGSGRCGSWMMQHKMGKRGK